MPVDFKVPDLGENIESGDIVNVLVKEGDQVAAEQPVFEVETGKAVVELPTPHAGKITKIHVEKGSKVKVGDLAADDRDGGPRAPPRLRQGSPGRTGRGHKPAPAARKRRRRQRRRVAPAAHADKTTAARRPGAAPASATAWRRPRPNRGRIAAGRPATRRLARELGVDLGQVNGTVRPAESPKKTSRQPCAADK